GGPVPDGGDVHGPTGGDEITMQTGHHNHKALHPHADIDGQRHQEKGELVSAHFARPEKLRDDAVEQDQAPEHPAIRTEGAIHHHGALKDVPAIPGHECLHDIAVD